MGCSLGLSNAKVEDECSGVDCFAVFREVLGIRNAHDHDVSGFEFLNQHCLNLRRNGGRGT